MAVNTLITGSNGAIGRHLAPYLIGEGYEVFLGVRKSSGSPKEVVLGDLRSPLVLPTSLRVSTIVHCAGLAHQMSKKDEKNFYDINVKGTSKLIDSCLSTGFRRFVFISSIKVLGESTKGAPFDEQDIPHPQNAYAQSKWEAEQLVLKRGREEGFEAVIVRPPLVYGGEMPKGNILLLLKWMQRGFPLPFGTIHNQRSMVHIDNLCSFIASCLKHPMAPGEIFHIADHDFSTPSFLAWVACHYGIAPKFVYCPVFLLKILGILVGKGEEVAKLTQSLQVSTKKVKKLMNWRPMSLAG